MFSCKFYVQGLPFDVKSREIHNLATRFNGCVRSYLSHCNGSPVGVLEFANFDAARRAAAALHNYPFDRDNQQYISVHFPDYYPSGTNVLEHNTLGVQRMWGGETHRRQMDTREDIAPAHEKRKILIKHLDIDTNEVNHPRPPSLCIVSTSNNDDGRLSAHEYMQEDLRSIFDEHAGFRTLRMVRKQQNLLVFVEFDFSQAAYDAVDEFSDGFQFRSSKTRVKLELANDGRRHSDRYQEEPRAPPRIQPRKLVRRNSEPAGASNEQKDQSASPKNKREEEGVEMEDMEVKKKNRTSPPSSGSSSSSSGSSSSSDSDSGS